MDALMERPQDLGDAGLDDESAGAAPASPAHCALFELPTDDLDRAVRFYEHVFATPLRRQVFAGGERAFFPRRAGEGGGVLTRVNGWVPSHSGTTVYLACADVNDVLARVPGAGGEILLPRSALEGGEGWFALLRDSEGNRIGVWSAR